MPAAHSRTIQQRPAHFARRNVLATRPSAAHDDSDFDLVDDPTSGIPRSCMRSGKRISNGAPSWPWRDPLGSGGSRFSFPCSSSLRKQPSRSPLFRESQTSVSNCRNYLRRRRLLWRHFVPQSEWWNPRSSTRLCPEHRVQIGEIASAARQNIQSAETALTFVRGPNRKKLDSLAQMLECPFTWTTS